MTNVESKKEGDRDWPPIKVRYYSPLPGDFFRVFYDVGPGGDPVETWIYGMPREKVVESEVSESPSLQ